MKGKMLCLGCESELEKIAEKFITLPGIDGENSMKWYYECNKCNKMYFWEEPFDQYVNLEVARRSLSIIDKLPEDAKVYDKKLAIY